MKKVASKEAPKKPIRRKPKGLTTEELQKFNDDLGPELIPRYLLNQIIYSEFKKPGGQTTFDYKYCDQIVYLGSKGIGVAQAVLYMGISIKTAYKWIKKTIKKKQNDGSYVDIPNPVYQEEFRKSVKLSKHLCKLWWIEVGRRNLGNKDFNNVLWMMNMSNRFGWRQRVDAKTESTHKEIKENHFVVHSLADDGELAEIIGILAQCNLLPEQGTEGNTKQVSNAKTDEVHSTQADT